ncbi:hypothetical protein HMPREF0535_2044, partial [Limosilactobacillus reuteri MM2-3]
DIEAELATFKHPVKSSQLQLIGRSARPIMVSGVHPWAILSLNKRVQPVTTEYVFGHNVAYYAYSDLDNQQLRHRFPGND